MYSYFQQILNPSISSKWSLSKTKYPIKVWGHCSVISKDGTTIYSTGGFTARNIEKNLKSTFSTDSASLVSSRLPDMKIGRSTHACLITKYKVSNVELQFLHGPWSAMAKCDKLAIYSLKIGKKFCLKYTGWGTVTVTPLYIAMQGRGDSYGSPPCRP